MAVHPPPPEDAAYRKEFQYRSLENADEIRAALGLGDRRTENAAAIYRGIVPAQNILHRDFAINGAIVRASSYSAKL